MNKKTILILSIVVLNILTSCNNNQAEVKKETTNINNHHNVEQKTHTIKNNFLEDSEDKNLSSLNDEGNKELMIDEKCIGCGKCAIIAPSNFVMDYGILKAVVISQKDMFSEEVSASIQYCPVDSIHIL